MEKDQDNICSFDPDLIVVSSPITKKVNHDWTIEDINSLHHDPRKAIDSIRFVSISDILFSLHAKLMEKSLQISLKGYKDNNEIKIVTKSCSFSVISIDFRGSLRTYDIPDQEVLDYMKGFEVPLCDIAGNSLAINFKGVLMSQEANHLTIRKPTDCTPSPEWIAKMINHTTFSDAKIKVSNEVFNVHKFVLASASRVFQAMFETDMQENNGIIEIFDFDSSVISDLLTYIYSGKAPNLTDQAKELLLAADKYEIQSLVCSCMQQLETDLTTENVVECFVLADKLAQDNPLKNTCLKFIQDNWDSVSESSSWEELKKTSKELALQAITTTARQQSTSRIKKDDISFQWVIENCKSLRNAKIKLKGPEIESEITRECLHFYVAFTERGIDVQFGDNEDIDNLWICNFFVTVPNQSITSEKCSKNLDQGSDRRYYSRWGPVKQIKVSLDDVCYSSDETLTLHVSAFLHKTNTYYHDTEISGGKTEGCELNYKTASFSDCTITVVDENGTEEFHVHKAILASASEFFLQILKPEANKIEINDIDREDMSSILTYIYSGTTPNIKKSTAKLLLAADKFHLDSLVKDCLFEIQKEMISSNVADYLCLSNSMTSCGAYLKLACIDFIQNNSISVFQSDSWKTLRESSVELVLEVAEEVIEKDWLS